MGKVIEFTLPLPPSVNNYYVHTRWGVRLGPEAKRYRLVVAHTVRVHGFRVEGRVGVTVTAFMDRRRDLDNLCKCLLDSLTKAKLWKDDSQVDDLHLLRGGKGDGLIVEVRELGDVGHHRCEVKTIGVLERLRAFESAAKQLLDSGDRGPLIMLMDDELTGKA